MSLYLFQELVVQMKAWSVAGVLLVLSRGSIAQKIGLTRQSGQWSFELYPVAATFKGKPAPPLLTTDLQHAYRSRIRSETRKGPNFAGLSLPPVRNR